MVLEGSKKTRVREDEGEAQPECLERKKTGSGRQEEWHTRLNHPDLGPYTCPLLKKTRRVDQGEGETQAECPEAKKMGHGLKGEWETRLSNGGCPFSSAILKKTADSDQGEGETQEERLETKKTERGHLEAWETSLNHPSIESGDMGCPNVCPAIMIPSVGSTGYLEAPSPRLRELLEGAEIPGDSGHPPDPPEWLDRDLFNEGRKFYRKYLFCLTFSELLSLLLTLSFGQILKPLIHTRRSDSATRARKRYMSTLFHLMSWFEGDVWDTSSPSHTDLMSIRNTHTRLGNVFNQSGEHGKVLKASVRVRGHREEPDSILPELKRDLRAAGVKEWRKEEEEDIPDVEETEKEERKKAQTFHEQEEEEKKERRSGEDGDFTIEEDEEEEEEVKAKKDQEKKTKKTGKQETEEEIEEEKNKMNMTPTHIKPEPNNNNTNNNNNNNGPFPVFISQLDMSLTQYAFMGLLLAHPEKLGAAGATRQELEGLIHFWRGLGWLLGIADRYNFCNGDLETTRALCLEVERDILLPRLFDTDWDYEHMVRSLMDGMGQILVTVSYPSMVRYLTHTLDVASPAIASTFTWADSLRYWLMRGTFGVLYYAPSYLKTLNAWLMGVFRRVRRKDKVNLAAYRKAQAALTVPIGGRKW